MKKICDDKSLWFYDKRVSRRVQNIKRRIFETNKNSGHAIHDFQVVRFSSHLFKLMEGWNKIRQLTQLEQHFPQNKMNASSKVS